MTEKKNILSLRNLTKRYVSPSGDKTVALHDVSLDLESGFYGLLGPNGSGKSTMINIITGGIRATSGNVFWNGKIIGSLGRGYYSILGFAPQQQGLYDSFTGQKFLNYFCLLKEIPSTAVQREIMRTAQSVGLVDELDKRISSYSGGMKQRLLLAQALLGDPQMLVLDEPTAGLDPMERIRLRDVLKKESEKGKIVIVATHVVGDVEGAADKLIFLKKGVIAEVGGTDDLIKRHNTADIERIYLSIFGKNEKH